MVASGDARVFLWLAGVVALVLIGTACDGPGLPMPATPRAVARASSPSASASAQPSPTTAATATTKPFTGPTFILLRATTIVAGARLNFQGQGFMPGEQASVTIEDARGKVEASLDPVTISKDGNIDEVSAVMPDAIGSGDHVLHVTGLSSGRTARGTFTMRYMTPRVTLDTYSAKADHTFGFTGSGFAPGELVDVRLGGLGGSPLASVPTDAQGNVVAQNVPLPLVQAGDYLLYFVGEQSQTPVSIGFNIQGFTPWVVLDNYSVAPYSAMGFSGEDFVPGDQIEVYLGQRGGEPLTRVAVDPSGRFSVRSAFNLPDVAHGDQRLIFVAHQSGAEIVAKFVVLPFSPGLELTNYAGRPGTPIAFTGNSWARGETLHVYVGVAREEVATIQADADGAFFAAGQFRLPVKSIPGGLPLTVRGEVSQADVTLWYQVLELKPSAELTAYVGPPGTVVSFTGRSFAGGELVRVHLQDRTGVELGSAVATDDGTIEQVSSYPVDGNWGEDVRFVLVGDESHAEGVTDFTIASPETAAGP